MTLLDVKRKHLNAWKLWQSPRIGESAVMAMVATEEVQKFHLSFWCAGTTPTLDKTLRECRGKRKSFGWVRGNSGNRSESCSENCGFCIDQVVRGHSEKGTSYSENGISKSESCSENTLELSESSENGLFTPRAFFPEIGVVPRLLNHSLYPPLRILDLAW